MEYISLLKPPNSRFLKAGKVTLLQGEEVGEHVTEKREEIVIVLKGTATLHKGDEIIELKEGETCFIKENIKHNIKNNSSTVLQYIYVVALFE